MYTLSATALLQLFNDTALAQGGMTDKSVMKGSDCTVSLCASALTIVADPSS